MKLATIEKIKSLRPIEGADRIELAEVLGFRSVVKKGEFQVGDLCVFILPDTVVEPRPVYEFLAKQGYRVKVARFRGQYSQGLTLPLESIRDYAPTPSYPRLEGQDVSDEAGVSKFEKPIPEGSDSIGPFPTILKKTDEPNLRASPAALAEFQGRHCYLSTKMDGTSATFFIDSEGVFRVYSRNQEMPMHSLWGRVARDYRVFDALLAHEDYTGLRVALQGEIYGPGINGNKGKYPKVELALFNLFNPESRRNLLLYDLQYFAERAKIPTVPIVWEGTCNFFMEDLILLANTAKYSTGEKAEGLVLRTVADSGASTVLEDPRLSVKIISEAFALKHGE